MQYSTPSLRRLVSAFFTALMFAGATLAAAAQSETTLYSFQNDLTDGNYPEAGLAADSSGALYGTTFLGGAGSGGGYDVGTVFKLTPPANPGGAWTEGVIFAFSGISGESPYCNLLIDQGTGTLYGTTVGGGLYGEGVVFSLTPPTQSGASWTETVLWNFGGTDDGAGPYAGVIADAQGRLYGTTYSGGKHHAGTVYRLSPPAQLGGVWSEHVLHSFAWCEGGTDGGSPFAGVVLDNMGHLYGTTMQGGFDNHSNGVAYMLTPPASGNGAWSETILHTFTGGSDGAVPVAS
jgi:uncharacterized repeat protein (TIGR03803 family)